MRTTVIMVLLVSAVLFLVWRPWDDSGAISEGSVNLNSRAAPESAGPVPRKEVLVTPRAVPNIDLERSPLADALNTPQGSIQRDLETLQELFAHYRSVFGGNPTGSNVEITSALSGTNKRLFAPLPRGHSAINREGSLVDRWKTPFFFHSLSAEFIEIRSAGPDRKLWTDDDLTLSNAPRHPAT